MAEKKFDDYPTHMKVAAVVTLLIYVACFIYLGWIFVNHIYRHEWLEAGLQVALLLLGWYWSANRKNKNKVKRLEIELAGLKASRKIDENAEFMKGWQAGIDFQRKILLKWAEQRRG